MKNFKTFFVIFLLAFVGLSNVGMAQNTFYINAEDTLRVKCWHDDASGGQSSLDTDCQLNLNGDEDGNNADTVIATGPFYVEAGNEDSQYLYYYWSDGGDTYAYLIEFFKLFRDKKVLINLSNKLFFFKNSYFFL